MESGHLLLIAVLLSLCSCQQKPTQGVSYDEMYVEGLKAHAAGKWKRAIPYFRRSVGEWQQLEEARSHCYTVCLEQRSKVPFGYSQEAELVFFHSVMERSRCVRHCQEDRLQGTLPRGGVPIGIFARVKKGDIWWYLQDAYHKLGQMREGARACTQYMYLNPHDNDGKWQLRIFKYHPNVTEDDLRPLDEFKYRDLWSEGHRQYYAEEWSEMVDLFEKALPELYTAIEQCRTMCEGPLLYTNTLGFYQTISILHSTVARCQKQCPGNLGAFRSDRLEEFMASFFHYLQYGYYFLDRPVDAVRASATRVRLDPRNNEAKTAAVFYKQRPGVTTKDFKPREDVLPAILKHEAVVSYSDMFSKLSDSNLEETEISEDEIDDLEMLEADIKRWPAHVLVVDQTTRTLTRAS